MSNLPRFSPEVNLGHLIQAAILGVGLTVYIVTQGNRIEQAQSAIQRAQSDIHDLRVDMNNQFAAVRNDISNLPDVRAQVTQLEKHSGGLDARLDGLDARVGKVERDDVGLRSDLDNLIRASDAQLPKGKR